MLRIGQVVGSATEPRAAGAEVLELFRAIVPYAAASLSAWDPCTDRHQTIVNANYPPAVVRHLDTWFVCHDEVYERMRTVDATPLRWRDMPFDYRRMYSAREVFMPMGFDEGVTTCLYTLDGRYTGSFHVSTDTRRLPSDAAIDALRILQSTLAGLVDVLRTPAWLAASLGPGEAAGIVTGDGEVVALPGHRLGADLAPGRPLARVVCALLGRGREVTRFLWQEDGGSWRRVHLHRLPGAVVVVEHRAELPYGLTPREVDVLTLMAEGLSNPEIATTLIVSSKTVAKHVEHVLGKLGCGSRTAAGARAVGEGIVCYPVGGGATGGSARTAPGRPCPGRRRTLGAQGPVEPAPPSVARRSAVRGGGGRVPPASTGGASPRAPAGDGGRGTTVRASAPRRGTRRSAARGRA